MLSKVKKNYHKFKKYYHKYSEIEKKRRKVITRIHGADIELDDQIADAIIELNSKGFTTFTCCSGHNTSDSFYGYVFFNKRPLKKFGKPNGWEYDNILFKDQEEGQEKQAKRIIRYLMDKNSNNKQSIIDARMESLREWIKTLPQI